MNTNYFSRLLAIVLFFTLSINLNATHIVGGEMTYTCLGNDQYEIELTIFRDCWNGNPLAYFDNPAVVGIYNQGELVDSLLIAFDPMLDDTLDPVLSDPCLTVPPNVCVHTTTYRDTVTLLPIDGGYELVYQRCCRNVTIANIVGPLDSGASYGVSISESALLECNSSAQFLNWPPIYICVNEPIDFDQSAIDPDGDSIVYQLCTPLLGATPAIPRPMAYEHTALQDPVVWLDPPYGLSNMLNGIPGGQVLEIDSQTGFLTGVPNTLGQFVVGICVEEYRDGVLISTTRRDFQFNVGVCGETISSGSAPEIICDEALTVHMTNLSENADQFEWYFNDPMYPDSVITDVEPSFTYSDTGAYSIMLIAEPGNTCVDTSWLEIQLNYESIDMDFNYTFTACTDSMTIEIADLTTDSISSLVQWDWTLFDFMGGVISTSGNQDPTFHVVGSQEVLLQLIVTAENGCKDTLAEAIEVELIEEELLADTVVVCLGDNVQLNPSPNLNYNYSWSPPDGLSNAQSGNPFASPSETTTYVVAITDNLDFCMIQREITVFVPPAMTLEVPVDTTICSSYFELFAISNNAVNYTWSTDAAMTNVISNDSSVVVTPVGENTYYLTVEDAFGCTLSEAVTVLENGINIEPDDQVVICDEEIAEVGITITDIGDTLTYVWSPDTYIIDGINSDTATVQPPGPGTYTFYIAMENESGCTMLDSVLVGVLDTTAQAMFVSEQQCSGYSIQFTNGSINAPYYLWDFGDPMNPGASSTDENPEYIYPGPGTYTVTLTVNAIVNCPDTIVQEVTVEEPAIEVDFQWEYEECGDSVVINFTDLSTNLQSTINAWEWIFSSGDTANIQNPSVVFTESQVLSATLNIFSDDGCNDSTSLLIPISVIEVTLADTLFSCFGEEVALNPTGNTDYDYEWSPSSGLSETNVANPLANPMTTTTYSVTITDLSVDTCELVQTITVEVPQLIGLATSNDTTICSEEITLFANSPQTTSYLWSDSPDFSNTISTDPTITVTPGQPSIYFVRVNDGFGCDLIDSIIVYGYNVDVSIPDYDFCINDTIQLIPTNNNTDDLLSFEWSPVSQIMGSSLDEEPFVSPILTQEYSAVVENQHGCADTIYSTVNVFEDAPPLIATANPDTIFLGESSQLLATEDTEYSYNWSPVNTLDDSSIFNPLAIPTESTTYQVEVQSDDVCNNNATVRVVVVVPVCDDPIIFFPNAFTPNGDGENDFLKVFGPNIDEAHWVIYNRWGQKVFETNEVDGEWDGTFNGEELAPDVFGYYLELKCLGGAEYVRKGNVTLLR